MYNIYTLYNYTYLKIYKSNNNKKRRNNLVKNQKLMLRVSAWILFHIGAESCIFFNKKENYNFTRTLFAELEPIIRMRIFFHF